MLFVIDIIVNIVQDKPVKDLASAAFDPSLEEYEIAVLV